MISYYSFNHDISNNNEKAYELLKNHINFIAFDICYIR